MLRRRLIRVALGVLLGGLVAAAWPSPAARPGGGVRWPALAGLGEGRLQDETAGRLTELVIHYTPAGGGELAPIYSQLLAALEPGTTVRVVVAEQADYDDLARRLAALGWPVRARLVPEAVGHVVSGWAKDRFISWVPDGPDAPGRALLIAPRPAATFPARLGDWPVPAELAARSGGRMASRELPLVFDGGDFAGGDDCVLAGWTLMTKNPGLHGRGLPYAREALTGLCGRPVVLLGEKPGDVPEHHVNMYALPIGGRRAVVGDVRLAARLAPAGELSAAGVKPDFSEECAERFDRVARQLEAAGFRVSRTPVVPLADCGDYGAYITYTNAFIETFPGGGRRIYLPTFGVEALDRAAVSAWQALGFEVRAINVGNIWRNGGSLDCLVGVIGRS